MSLVDKGAIAIALLVLSCGHVLWWRRRDNVASYVAGGLFFASTFVPVFFTGILDSVDQPVSRLYARVLVVGAAAYLCGLFYGAPHGLRCRRPPVTFTRSFADGMPSWLIRRARIAAVAGIVLLAGSFALLGYIPLLATDRRSAKYGIGPYAAGFARGALPYHVAIAIATLVSPVIMMAAYRYRRHIDLALTGGLFLVLLLTLNRGIAFAGPLIFLVALSVERRRPASLILALTCLAFVGATLVNQVLYTAPPTTRPSLANQVASSAPDISDHLLFLRGFGQTGSQYVGTKTLTAGLNVVADKGYYNPSHYALRTITGLSSIEDFASGGARLPAPIWGYAAYGYVGAVVWSFAAGVAVGFGTTLFRRLLADANGEPGQAINLVVASVVYAGTVEVLGTFYFPQRVGLVALGVAVALGVRRREDPSAGQFGGNEGTGRRTVDNRTPGRSLPH